MLVVGYVWVYLLCKWEKYLIDIVLYSGNSNNNTNNSNSSNEGCSNDNKELLSFPLSALPTINPSSTLNYGKCRPGFLGDSHNKKNTSNRLDNVFIGGCVPTSSTYAGKTYNNWKLHDKNDEDDRKEEEEEEVVVVIMIRMIILLKFDTYIYI